MNEWVKGSESRVKSKEGGVRVLKMDVVDFTQPTELRDFQEYGAEFSWSA
jgi:hypothetical protein